MTEYQAVGSLSLLQSVERSSPGQLSCQEPQSFRKMHDVKYSETQLMSSLCIATEMDIFQTL